MNQEVRARIDRLVGDLVEGEDCRSTAEELRSLIHADSDAAAAYAESIELHALLEARHAAALAPFPGVSTSGIDQDDSTLDRRPQDSAASAFPEDSDSCAAGMAELWGFIDEATVELRQSERRVELATKRANSHAWRRWAVPSVCAVAIAGLLMVLQPIATPDDTVASRTVGVLTKATDAEWGTKGAMELPCQIDAGQRLALEGGVAELTLHSGVVVVMRGPAEIELVSPMRVRARRGTVRARVGETAKGFVLETPTTEVIDLGTEFGVDIDTESGATDVVVFDGSVDLRYTAQADRKPLATRAGASGRETRLLRSGEALRVDRSGSTSRIVSIHSDSYPAAAAMQPITRRPPLIRAVTDNHRAQGATQYYQIVEQGFREDCQAYVDRYHQWNGIDASGMPTYLLGADYVMTFNSDKFEADVSITVDIAAPATLYLMFDDRLDPPDWLASRFTRTPDKIGVDESYRRPRMPMIGHGAGNSIDTSFSIWRRDIPEPQLVKLGALPKQIMAVSMYGIAAAPLQAGIARTSRQPVDDQGGTEGLDGQSWQTLPTRNVARLAMAASTPTLLLWEH